MGREIDTFFKGDIQMDSKYMKRCSVSLIIKGMQVKNHNEIHLSPVRMAIIKQTRDNKHWWQCTAKGNCYSVDGNINCFSHYGKQHGGSRENLK